jgi:hypothetical protein
VLHRALENFARNISLVFEDDYGDFMRKVNLYLDQLESELRPLANPEIELKLSVMKSYIQYTPSWNVDATRRNIFADISELEKLIK